MKGDLLTYQACFKKQIAKIDYSSLSQYGLCFICGQKGVHQRYFTKINPVTGEKEFSSGRYMLLCKDHEKYSRFYDMKRFKSYLDEISTNY